MDGRIGGEALHHAVRHVETHAHTHPSFFSHRMAQYCLFEEILTRKNVMVEPPSSVPYEISVCSAKSAAFSMGVIMRSTVKNAAKLAVYEDIIINVKNHQIPPTIRVDVAFDFISVTCQSIPKWETTRKNIAKLKAGKKWSNENMRNYVYRFLFIFFLFALARVMMKRCKWIANHEKCSISMNEKERHVWTCDYFGWKLILTLAP